MKPTILRTPYNQARFNLARVEAQQRTLKTAGIAIAILGFICLSLLFSGCGTNGPLITPAAFGAEVGQSVAIGLDVYPQAAPDVKIARDVVCAEVGKTNISPSAITADLAQAGITNSNSKLIVDGALLLYNGVFVLLTTNQTASAQPYLDALCQGLTQGLPADNPMARRRARLLPPHLR